MRKRAITDWLSDALGGCVPAAFGIIEKAAEICKKNASIYAHERNGQTNAPFREPACAYGIPTVLGVPVFSIGLYPYVVIGHGLIIWITGPEGRDVIFSSNDDKTLEAKA